MPIIKNLLDALMQFLKPSKTILYDTVLTEDEIYSIVNARSEYAKNATLYDRMFGGRIYNYFITDEKIFLIRDNHQGGHDTSAYIEIITNRFSETIFSVTYYKPLLLALAFTAFGALISVTIYWWGIFVGFIVGFGMNYLLFLSDWKEVEADVKRVFKIE